MPRAARLAVVVVLACVPGLLGGCGSGASSGAGDPSSAVPADAPLYFEAMVRPEGDQREDALAAAGKVLNNSDPEKRIEELMQEAFADSEDPKLDYARDVKPWLGRKIGFWLSATSGEESKGAAVAASTDADKAKEAIDRAVEGSDKRFSERSYKDADYRVNTDGAAVAVLDDYVVLGTEAELKQSISALEGKSLADNDRYKDAIGGLPDDRLAQFYLDTKTLIDQAVKQDPEVKQQLEQIRGVLPLDKLGAVSGSFSANGERLALDTLTSAEGGEVFRKFGGLFGGTGSTPLLGELPGDSWGALGSPKLGQTVKDLYTQVAGALGGAALEQQLRQELGIDLQQDVFSWIGDVAFFVRGTSVAEVDGGAVIEVTDSGRATAAFGKLVGLLRTRGGIDAQPVRVEGAESAFSVQQPGVPKPVVIARGENRAVIAYGREAAEQAFAPPEKLADGDTYGEAKSLLGDEGMEPSFLLSMPAVVALAASASGGDPEFAKAKPYLDAFSILASGGKIEDDRARSRAVAGLK